VSGYGNWNIANIESINSSGNSTKKPFRRMVNWLLHNEVYDDNDNVTIKYADKNSSYKVIKDSGTGKIDGSGKNVLFIGLDYRTWFNNNFTNLNVDKINTVSAMDTTKNYDLIIVSTKINNDTGIDTITNKIDSNTSLLVVNADDWNWGYRKSLKKLETMINKFGIKVGEPLYAGGKTIPKDREYYKYVFKKIDLLSSTYEVLKHIKNNDWVESNGMTDVNLSNYSKITMYKSTPKLKEYTVLLDTFAKTKKYIHDNFDSKLLDAFASRDTTTNRFIKLVLLYGDVVRKEVKFPYYKTYEDQKHFLEWSFVEYAINFTRQNKFAQPDTGVFMPKDFNYKHPYIMKDINKTYNVSLGIHKLSSWLSTGLFAVPGVPFKVTRLDNQPVYSGIALNFHRDGSLRELEPGGAKVRPRVMRNLTTYMDNNASTWYTSPMGGPIYIQINTPKDENIVDNNVTYRFENGAVRMPMYDLSMGEKDPQHLIDFVDMLQNTNIPYAEIRTPIVSVHSTMYFMKLMYQGGRYRNNIKAYLKAIQDYPVGDLYETAGFIKRDIGMDPYEHIPLLKEICDKYDYDCQNAKLHKREIVQHYNAERPSCGDGCAGNPVDAWVPFSPTHQLIGHEFGHNLQRPRTKAYGG
jgi:hypothetical protein